MRYIFWIFVAVLAALAANFAASNRVIVDLTFWPLPFVLSLPVYLIVLAVAVAGFLAGRIAGSIAASPVRRERRRLRMKLLELEAGLARARPGQAPAAPVMTAPSASSPSGTKLARTG